MNNYAVYCGVRFLAYRYLYGLIFSIISVIVAAVCSIAFVIIIGDYPLNLQKFWATINNLSARDAFNLAILFGGPFLIIFMVSAITLAYPLAKIAFNKMFFKPYKKFILTPKVEKIMPKVVFIYLGVMLLVEGPIFWINAKFQLGSGIGSNIVLLLLALVVELTSHILLARYFVNKYATISFKTREA